MDYDFTPLIKKAVTQYHEKIEHICLECPQYPNNCPPQKCPTHLSLKLPACSTRGTLLTMIKAYSSSGSSSHIA